MRTADGAGHTVYGYTLYVIRDTLGNAFVAPVALVCFLVEPFLVTAKAGRDLDNPCSGAVPFTETAASAAGRAFTRSRPGSIKTHGALLDNSSGSRKR